MVEGRGKSAVELTVLVSVVVNSVDDDGDDESEDDGGGDVVGVGCDTCEAEHDGSDEDSNEESSHESWEDRSEMTAVDKHAGGSGREGNGMPC